ncbi:MAG: DUF4153 domain-containing protein [Hyphomicrobiaceae bacterium]|nr:DUF4153 domain-containing protein [Hyphomicrobiaceae bacterium]
MALTRNSLLNALKSFTPDVGAAVRRFPLASLIALTFTLLHLFEINKVFGLSGDAWMRVSFGLGTAFLWSLATSLYAERHHWSVPKRTLIELAGFAVVALFFAQPVLFALQPQLVFLSAGISVGLAAYVRVKDASNAAFWQFNHHLWLGAGLSLVGALLFAGGLSLIVETLELLFEVDFPGSTHEKIWTVAFGLIAPLNWLSLTPQDFAETAHEGEQDEFTSRAVAVIVKYILAPLLLVYTAILYAYAVKIAIDGMLPKGRLGPMVLAYGALMTLTVLLAWPARMVSGPLVTVFWRHWFWLILGPVALLFLAVYQRIDQYGLTDERYIVTLAGLWLAFLAIWFLLRGGVRDLRVLPASLAVALFLASFGPWGAVGVSVRSQTAQLAALLERQGRLKDGRIVVPDTAKLLPRPEGRRAASILRYLERNHSLHTLEGWFDAAENSPFQPGSSTAKTSKAILKAIGAPAGAHVLTEAEHLNFTATRPVSLQVSAFDAVIGPLAVKRQATNVTLEVENGGKLSVDFENNVLTVRLGDGRTLLFDVAATAREALVLKPPAKPSDQGSDPRVPLRVFARGADDGSVLVIENMWGRVSDEFVEVRLLRGWLLIKGN